VAFLPSSPVDLVQLAARLSSLPVPIHGQVSRVRSWLVVVQPVRFGETAPRSEPPAARREDFAGRLLSLAVHCAHVEPIQY
jgi:hypothetical protein